MIGVSSRGTLGMPELIAMGVGGMIGGGMFSIMGVAVGVSGHAAPLAFLVGSVISFFGAYCYIKLSLKYRNDGASFTYLERAFPKRLEIAGIAGWAVVVGYIGALALVSLTFGAYAAHLFGMSGSLTAQRLLSIGVLLLFMILNVAGTATMGRVEDFIVYLKIVLLLVLITVGFYTLDTHAFSPLVNKGVPSIFFGGAVIFIAYAGFQFITNAIMETHDPERNIPWSIYISIAIVSIIYVAIAAISVGNLTPEALQGAKEYALAVVAQPILGRAGVILVDIAAILATSSAINATLFGSSRLAAEMATESLAPSVFSFHTHKSSSPIIGIAVITFLGAVFTTFSGLEAIASFSSLTFLLVLIGVAIACYRLRQEVGASVAPIIIGLVLMILVAIALAWNMATTNPMSLVLTAGIYIVVAIAHFVFDRVRESRKR
jgi:amino acid transporter